MLYGIYGDGLISAEAVTEHIGRLADAAQIDDGEVWFLVHIPEEPGEGLLNVIDFLNENELWWKGFSSTDDFNEDAYEGSQEEAVIVKSIGRKIVAEFKKEDDVALLALYTDGGDTEEMMEVLEIVSTANGCYLIQDLSDGLTPIELADEDADDEDDDNEKAVGGKVPEPRYTQEELEALELKELRALALAEGKSWKALHHTQSNAMRKAAIIKYLLGEDVEVPEAEEESAAKQEAPTSRRGRGRPAKAVEPEPEEEKPTTKPADTPTIREIFVKHLKALIAELEA